MSFHDKIAQKAILDGQTVEQYRNAAQNHATTTWIFFIISLAVWFLGGWFWALIPLFLAAFKAIQSISATMVAMRLERLMEVRNTDKNDRIPSQEEIRKALKNADKFRK